MGGVPGMSRPRRRESRRPRRYGESPTSHTMPKGGKDTVGYPTRISRYRSGFNSLVSNTKPTKPVFRRHPDAEK